MQEWTNTESWYQEWSIVIKIPENVGPTLELGNGQRLEEFRELRRRQEDKGSLELLRYWLNNCDQNADRNMGSEVHVNLK